MRRERITCTVNIDRLEPNVLIIKPFHLKDFEDDSIYEFKLPDLKAKNGTTIKSQKIKYITKPSIMYASIEDIRNILGDIDISDETILYNIKEASRLVEVIIQKAFDKQNVAFDKEYLQGLNGNLEEIKNNHNLVWQFVTLKASYESLTTLYIAMVTSPDKVKEVLSDLSKEYSFNLRAIKDLLDDYKKRLEDIVDLILTIADPVFALRGRTAMPINIDLGAPYYNLNGMGGYTRSYQGFGNYNRGGRF